MFVMQAAFAVETTPPSLNKNRKKLNARYLVSISKLSIEGAKAASLQTVEGYLESLKDNNRCYFKVSQEQSKVRCRHPKGLVNFDFAIQTLIQTFHQSESKNDLVKGYQLMVNVLNGNDEIAFKFDFDPLELKEMNDNFKVVKRYF